MKSEKDEKMFQDITVREAVSILFALSITPLCVCAIKSILKMADSKLSYHLDDLKLAGLVSTETQGRFIVYSITDMGRKLLWTCGRLGTTSPKRKIDGIRLEVA